MIIVPGSLGKIDALLKSNLHPSNLFGLKKTTLAQSTIKCFAQRFSVSFWSYYYYHHGQVGVGISLVGVALVRLGKSLRGVLFPLKAFLFHWNILHVLETTRYFPVGVVLLIYPLEPVSIHSKCYSIFNSSYWNSKFKLYVQVVQVSLLRFSILLQDVHQHHERNRT